MEECKLKLIKGDTLSLNISISDVDVELIDKIYFNLEELEEDLWKSNS